jgi:hypothetical protein
MGPIMDENNRLQKQEYALKTRVKKQFVLTDSGVRIYTPTLEYVVT